MSNMYRLVLIVLLNAAFSLGCRPPPCHWNNPKPVENYFDQVARKVINADRKAQEFCYRQGTPSPVENHGVVEYKLLVPGAGGATYEIKVHGRALQIVSDGCQNSVTDLFILPTYVDGYGGKYYFDNNDLVVTFPYKYDPAVGGSICEEVNNSPVTTLNLCNTCGPIY